MGVAANIVHLFRKLTSSAEPRIVDKRKSYVFSVSPKEKLPLDVWVYLVKKRANFRCENCENKHSLDSHHIIPIEYKGKNVLKNGRCLCRNCHSLYRSIPRNSDIRNKFIAQYGVVKGEKVFEEYRACQTHKEMKQLSHKLVKKDTPILLREFDKRLKQNPINAIEWMRESTWKTDGTLYD